MSPAVELALRGSLLLVLLIGGARVARDATSLGELMAFLLYATYLVVPLASVLQGIGTVQKGMGAMQRVHEIGALPVEDDGGVARAGGTGDGAPVLEFRNVRFRYGDRPVLRGVSFAVPPCSHVALVGRSGAGKSTVFSLTERFYDPGGGSILFHGKEIVELSRADCRSRIALVDQNTPILHGSLRDNLCYTVPGAGTAEIERVVELVNLTELVDRLPLGLDTPVGERGNRLSGGECQRIAIARALLARAIARAAEECALLVIAHRLSTVRQAGRIVVLDAGKVVADGRHEELVEYSSYYRTLVLGGLRDGYSGNAKEIDVESTSVS
ncbi:ATP-binding cassette domain-containing protein [Qaidamihabitans albus]|uniref:ATP-binding cassette domain-containing protein n=1 Tax=Qaidamihabitans albus TaxID=2795733 RepID=UPI0018F212F4|nr:ABC transporter ATP-binding protein [Qaidamihabitans albus]